MDKTTHKTYAIKFIYKEDVDEELVKNEVIALHVLNSHEGFVHIHGHFTDKNFFILVLDK